MTQSDTQSWDRILRDIDCIELATDVATALLTRMAVGLEPTRDEIDDVITAPDDLYELTWLADNDLFERLVHGAWKRKPTRTHEECQDIAHDVQTGIMDAVRIYTGDEALSGVEAFACSLILTQRILDILGPGVLSGPHK